MTTEIKEQQLSLNGITGAAHADDRPNSEMAGELILSGQPNYRKVNGNENKI